MNRESTNPLSNMRPPSLHSNFFSSLKQVEKRLKLENPSQPSTLSPPPPPPGETNYAPIESLSSPIYLNFDQPKNFSRTTSSSSSSFQSSEPPREFFSNSLDLSETHDNPYPSDAVQDTETINRAKFDEIELLIQLLGLSDCEDEKNRFTLALMNGGEKCGHECGFYSKIVGVKGPKCRKEVERLEEWIDHFRNDRGEGRREPLRLAHLLLAKAAFLSADSDGFSKIEFPSTVEEFLHNDPPIG